MAALFVTSEALSSRITDLTGLSPQSLDSVPHSQPSPQQDAYPGLPRVARMLLRALRCTTVTIYLRSTARVFSVSREANSGASACATEILTLPLADHVLHKRKPLIVSDARQHASWELGHLIRAAGAVAYLALPLFGSDGALVGVIAAGDSAPREWSGDELETVRDHAACLIADLEGHALLVQLSELSQVDELTHLYNRRGFLTCAERQLRLAERAGHELSVLFVDVNGMKQVNDTKGHAMGDQLLMDVAQLLRQTFRESDVLARLGGDEFAVLAVESGPDCAGTLCARLHQRIDEFNAAAKREYHVTVSIGVAGYDPSSPTSIAALLLRADERMYHEKQRRRRFGSAQYRSVSGQRA